MTVALKKPHKSARKPKGDGHMRRGEILAAAEKIFIAEGYGYQPPEHWQMIHDAAVASGALEQPLEDLSSVYTNEFVAGWNA